MTSRPSVIRTVPLLRRALARWRAKKAKVALVPTMGALHKGHLSLVKLAQRRADRVIVSIFVNPAQFAPHEDFGTYPRTFEADMAALAETGADLVWAPTSEVMYPSGFATRLNLDGPATVGLEDRFRPHFFGGVAIVVSKLLIQCQPDIAVFGEKDYQQLKVISRLVQDLDLPVKIVGAPIARESDGLAMSSRNVYLSKSERAIAPMLYRVLQDCADEIRRGTRLTRALQCGASALVKAGFALDYLEARDAQTLQTVKSARAPIRLLVAARLGTTRLIDNIGV